MYCRKDFLDLTPIERDRLANAFNELWDQNRFQVYGPAHEAGWFSIHRGPEFLPWHRWFILRLEQELRSFDARVSLPYWDWVRNSARDLDAEPWKSFFGGRDNTGGRFDHWTYTRRSDSGGNVLPGYATLINELDQATYAAFRAEEGGSHVPGHTWTGGTMSTRGSPGDPLFFLHHCNVDRIWALWQMNNAGADQYTQDPSSVDDPNFTGSKDGPNDVMFAGSLGGGTTPAAMLDHRALGYRYAEDPRLAAEWAAVQSTTLISGDPTTVTLATSAVVFDDVPEGDTTMRAARFSVDGCRRLFFEVTAGPTGPFSLDESGPFAFPPSDFPTSDLRIWILFTGEAPGTNANGLVSIRAVDALTSLEVDRWDDIPIAANSIARPTAAVALILDESGSMLYDAGNNRDTRLEVLQIAATTFIDQLFDDNGLMMVAFDESGSLLQALDVAGGQVSAVRNAARQEILNHGPPNTQPHTSIGAGIETASTGYASSPLTSTFDVQAMVVFTDGVSDRQPWISEVETSIPDRVYAVGVASAANVDSNKLREIANGTGGFMLHQGAVTDDDEFMLEKFFLQILAGVLNRDIITDPPGLALPGIIDSVPFSLNRSDVQFDAVVLSRYPQALILGLRTPDGGIVGPSQLPAGAVRVGATSRTLRVTLPLVINGVEYWEGDWELLLALGYGRHKKTRHVASLSNVAQIAAVPYHAVVHARSSLSLRATASQTGLTPGSDVVIRAVLSEYGQPLPTHPTVTAELKLPAGPIVTLSLTEGDPGVFETTLTANQSGIYRFRIIADGFSRRGRHFTREQLLTAVVGQPTRNPDGTPPWGGDPDSELCRLVSCLLSDRVLTDRLRERLKELGLDLEQLRRCLAQLCRPDDDTKQTLAVLRQPEVLRALQALAEGRT